MATASPSETARLVVDLAAARAPTLGGGRLVCVDGPAGSGKTTLAGAVVDAGRRRGWQVALVHMDDLYDGWTGLATVERQTEGLLRPLAAGRPGRYRRYDWQAGRFAETVTVPPADLVVLEGVGSGAESHADLVTLLVWVSAPDDVRLRRGLQRDGEALEPQWRRWLLDEVEHFARHGTAGRADLLVDGTGATAPVRPPE